MPINVLENSSQDNNKKIETNIFVQKPYLKSNYIESKIEEEIDFKQHYKVKKSPDPIRIRDACSENHVERILNDPSILKNTADIDLNNRKITNARFIRIFQLSEVGSPLTAKL